MLNKNSLVWSLSTLLSPLYISLVASSLSQGDVCNIIYIDWTTFPDNRSSQGWSVVRPVSSQCPEATFHHRRDTPVIIWYQNNNDNEKDLSWSHNKGDMGPGSDMDRKPSYEEDIGGFLLPFTWSLLPSLKRGNIFCFLSGEAKERCRCYDKFYSWCILSIWRSLR